jgi:hypothetical protein
LTASERRELSRLHEKLLRQLPDGRPPARCICRFCDVLACRHHDGRCPVTQGVERLAAGDG